MPYITSVERIARKEGFAQGFQEGRLEVATAFVLRLLPKRCGVLSPELLEQVQALSLEQLEDLCEALLDFADVQDLEDWLNQQ
ncbi:DUF4351 domain-containing protein [Synechococcus elongatus]|uniref:DUF4351 domain-containing protein n=2 Tax=Synechococcus elongatus TaxID=32046 RepID=Q31PC6_SYNE7|nr:DUF4351 domain-containing protein [Synechococcus elongatus]ABB57093.1 conserved hypothetical protein [Synechococcus elongatus PCC 7942 = FACHB-805]AJD58389.1 hypothetical protein M744_11360 [Synechococcus elongatus UTEX 2973]MBD2587495.1 DUF4351 domain-containing protein [Synechococcus elongatus FACHB-242]MBD2688726.1 DUF4351 domain-containing protein [Synechococcus elongatus FACHB-1061]MBD2707797.1 DUF4351 domain-containing protein [Synechococcus elongatus PCC 7942 = FACHB-805]